ncbi:hypothetical protein V6N12_059470 [Hibiscus sabdariffa]
MVPTTVISDSDGGGAAAPVRTEADTFNYNFQKANLTAFLFGTKNDDVAKTDCSPPNHDLNPESTQSTEMATGTAPPRGSAAAAASLRRRRTTSGGGASGGAAGTMLQFYTDDAPGLKISPNVVLVMSIGFIAFVAILHVMGKLYFVRKD